MGNPESVQSKTEDWESIAKGAGPYLVAALELLYCAGVCLTVGPVEKTVWGLYGELRSMVAAMGRFAPYLPREDMERVNRIVTGVERRR